MVNPKPNLQYLHPTNKENGSDNQFSWAWIKLSSVHDGTSSFIIEKENNHLGSQSVVCGLVSAPCVVCTCCSYSITSSIGR